MATIRKRNGKWHVQVRRAGHPNQTKTFLSKPDAQKWGRLMEATLDKQVLPHDPKQLEQTIVADLLTRYRDTVTPNKRGAASERKRIDVFMRQDWSKAPLSRANAQVFSQFRDQRLKVVQPGTVIRDLGLLRAIFETAIREWSLPLPENPLAKVRKPKAPDARERRLEAGELELILQACQDSRNDWLRPGILFAIETGMRRGELLNIRWRHIDHTNSTLIIPETKNGHARCIPLSDRALSVLSDFRPNRGQQDEYVFPVSANAFRLAWPWWFRSCRTPKGPQENQGREDCPVSHGIQCGRRRSSHRPDYPTNPPILPALSQAGRSFRRRRPPHQTAALAFFMSGK